MPRKLLNLHEYHARPLTVIYAQTQHLPAHLLAADGSVAIRIVRDDFCTQLIQGLGRPLISTSANISGEATPKHFGEVNQALQQAVDYVVNYRQNDRKEALPSTIIRLAANEEEMIIIRP